MDFVITVDSKKEKIMKKLIILLVVIALAFSFTACDEKVSNSIVHKNDDEDRSSFSEIAFEIIDYFSKKIFGRQSGKPEIFFARFTI